MDRRRIDPNLPPYNNTSNSDSNFPHNPTISLSPPDFLRNVQAAFKRHRMMPQLKPRRLVVRGETSKSSDQVVHSTTSDDFLNASISDKVQDSILQKKNMISACSVNQEHALNMPPTISNKTNDEGIYTPVDAERGQVGFGTGCASSSTTTSSFLEREHGPLFDGPKKVQFALENNATHEMECDGNNQLDVSTALCQDARHQNFQNFIQSDFGNNMTQSSVVGSSCATTTLVNSEYAPMLNSTTHCSRLQHNSFVAGEYSDIQDQPMPQAPREPNYDNKMLSDSLGSLFPSAAVDPPHLERKDELFKGGQGEDPPLSTKGSTFVGDITDIQSQAPMTDPFSNVKTGPSKSEKKEKADANKSTRKKSYDPDFYFKVNGKLYQRLGKIGSGGSSEVHKVISQDCTIYALKKIKLKGRDYATAFGFCQEIEYLNKLRGKDHIIQLIDYEVTDKALLKEVMSGSLSNKDGKVKDDGYIYMVLEYGEIDLAHMLSHKWKELDKSKQTIDENWLRFYWQQILLAVKTIHEERIVHSDLKPANFLLVSGSLKLIDFGIAKAIMSDTTNIQRDSQVGTLSYMSPEAYMCNETDANGNVIKCGRPSDIWSLGCILYQMVYGRTPFADYKTFWAKFKVVTDPDHEIQYEPVSNPWLLDLMKNCLAWDRYKRWRIPELLQHPFLVPPIPSLEDRKCKLIQLVSDSCIQHPKALMLCTQLEQLLSNPLPDITPDESIVVKRRRAPMLLYEMSKLCIQLKEQLEQPQ